MPRLTYLTLANPRPPFPSEEATEYLDALLEGLSAEEISERLTALRHQDILPLPETESATRLTA